MSVERKFWKVTRWARAGRFWLFLILAALAFLGIGEANAQSCPPTIGARQTAAGISQTYPTAQAAVAACNATGSPGTGNVTGGWHDRFDKGQCSINVQTKNVTIQWVHIGVWSSCTTYYGDIQQSKNQQATGWAFTATCPADQTMNPVTGVCEVGCASREPLGSHSARGSMTVCNDGCQFEQGVGVCLGTGPTMYCYAGQWVPTGNQCAASDAEPQPHNPNDDTCRSTGGGWNECVKPNGDHCVTSPRGTRMCWQPGQTGDRSNAQGTDWASREAAGETPTPPGNVENPTQETTTGDKGGVSGGGVGGSFTIGGGSGTGNTGGQGNTGSGGSGSGSGGSGSGDGDDDGPGTPGDGVGTLYEGTGDTVGTHVAAHVARMQNAPIIAAATGFLSVNLGGSCPVFSFSFMGREVVIDFYCRQEFAQVYTWVGYFMLFIFGWAAFRIGVLD